MNQSWDELMEQMARLREGLAHEKAGEPEEAYAAYRQVADTGDGRAMLMIGNLYLYKKFRGVPRLNISSPLMPWDGVPTEPDVKTAYSWFRKAAEAGVPQAVKALKDFFGESVDAKGGHTMSDEAYDRQLGQFREAAERGDRTLALAYYGPLMNGSEAQISRLGYVLAAGLFRASGFHPFGFPNLREKRTGAPVWQFRCGWATAVVINLRAFPEAAPVFTFASDIRQHLAPVWGIRPVEGTVEYDAEPFGWLGGRRRARLMKVERGFRGDTAPAGGVDVKKLLDALALTEDDALFIEDGEKEFSVEIGHVTGGSVEILWRYTVDGADQGIRPAQVSAVHLPDGL